MIRGLRFSAKLLVIAITVSGGIYIAGAAESAPGPKIDKDAHAEAILWEIWVSDDVVNGVPYTVKSHKMKVDVFDARGAEMLSKVDIPHLDRVRVSDVWARTLKKTGETVELKKDAIFNRMIVKAGGVKIKATSFALPGVEPGAVVEYGWREREDEHLSNYVALPLQQEYPVQTVRYHLKPLVHYALSASMRAQAFNIPQPPFEPEGNGSVSVTFTNIPASREEPDMPPTDEVSPWMLVYYAPQKNETPEQYWHNLGKTEFEQVKDQMKVNGDVKRKAAELLNGATNDDERLRKIYEFCRSGLKNLAYPGAAITQEQRQDFKQNKSPADTIKQGIGTPADIDFAFAALANAAGLEARYARMSDRSRHFFHKEYANAYFLRTWAVAVRVNDKWRFFDPGVPHVPFGMLPWYEEGNFSLIVDGKSPEMVLTEMSPPEKSVRRQFGRFELSDTGTLEGDVRVMETGHRMVDTSGRYDGLKEEEQEATLKKEIEEQFPGAEVSHVEVANLRQAELPLTLSCHIKLEGYAQRTGRRLFLQPSVFERGHPARFTASSRQFPVYFHYPWKDIDQVTIKLPAGFELDNADMPPSIPLQNIGAFRISATYDKVKRELVFNRELSFAENLGLIFPVKSYPALKQLFDLIHSADDHAITLKQEAAK